MKGVRQLVEPLDILTVLIRTIYFLHNNAFGFAGLVWWKRLKSKRSHGSGDRLEALII